MFSFNYCFFFLFVPYHLHVWPPPTSASAPDTRPVVEPTCSVPLVLSNRIAGRVPHPTLFLSASFSSAWLPLACFCSLCVYLAGGFAPDFLACCFPFLALWKGPAARGMGRPFLDPWNVVACNACDRPPGFFLSVGGRSLNGWCKLRAVMVPYPVTCTHRHRLQQRDPRRTPSPSSHPPFRSSASSQNMAS